MKSHEDLTFDIEGFLNEISTEQENKKEDVVKVKRFPLRPMSSEEAAMQMDLLGHSFFMFRDAESGSVSVIYRRKDGGFGILVPEE
jgi:putative sigma-54 modulation protein